MPIFSDTITKAPPPRIQANFVSEYSADTVISVTVELVDPQWTSDGQGIVVEKKTSHTKHYDVVVGPPGLPMGGGPHQESPGL